MKGFGFLLLAANLALFGWYMSAPPPAAATSPESQAVATAQKLVMVSELAPTQKPATRTALAANDLPAGVDTPQEPEVPTQEAAPADSVPSAICFHVTGFVSEPSAVKSKAALEKLGAVVNAPEQEQFERVRYWVLLPPSASPAKALTVVERLKRAGIRDYYLIPSGPNRNALSLGVFSTRDAAHRRVREVASLKLKVRVEEVKYPGRRFALEVRWSHSEAPAWKRLLPAGVESATTECATKPAIAPGAPPA